MIAPNPDFLKGYVLCEQHGRGGRAPWTCPFCRVAQAMNEPASTETFTVKVTVAEKPKPGKATEDELHRQLTEAGYEVVTFATWFGTLEAAAVHGAALSPTTAVREYRWGLLLNTNRGFRSDFAFPLRRLLVEIEGGAHAVKRQRKADVLRQQLAEAAGWRVLSVLPEQVRAQDVVGMVRKALGEESEGFGEKQEGGIVGDMRDRIPNPHESVAGAWRRKPVSQTSCAAPRPRTFGRSP